MVYNISMRIITGKYKGRKLVAPNGNTRPTLDRAKETLFNMLGDLRGATVLDLFAGSGQIAAECLSRGAVRAVMCDNSREAAQAIVENFAKLGEKPELYKCEYSACLRALVGAKFDLVYVDPPYKSGVYNDVLTSVVSLGLLADDGEIVCEHVAELPLPQQIAGLVAYKSRKVGTVMFTFYRMATDEYIQA